MPEFYQVLNPLLPFTYSIDAMREAIGGMYGAHYLIDMLILGGCFIPVGLFIGLMGVHFGYNVNTLFDAKLSQTELFASESVPKGAQWFRLRARAAGTHANEAIPRKDHRTRHEVRYKIPAAHEDRLDRPVRDAHPHARYAHPLRRLS